MILEELKQKASLLPMAPGVYLMKDKHDTVIYVGKAKKLKNRVSQYFQDMLSHTPKTRLMVSKINHFDVIVAASEFEALVLECSLIKRYMPKYNILLKDDKGYPYLRLDMKDMYPRLTMVNKPSDDGAGYFGPYGSRGITHQVMETILQTLKLPNCSKQFPRDLEKGRPCLYFHMDQCAGWCQGNRSNEEYRIAAEQARQLLLGNYKAAAHQLREQMLAASEALNFELAANLRDQYKAVEALGQKQLVTAGSLADVDVIGFAQTEAKACFTVLHFSKGNLLDKDYEVLPIVEDVQAAVSSLVKQYYVNRGYCPKIVLLPLAMEDSELLEKLLEEQYGRRPRFKVPQRGDNVRLVEMAVNNALEEAQRVTTKEEKNYATLLLLGKMLCIDTPFRIESFDISNISGTDIVASMIVYQNCRPKRSEYKRFKIEDLMDQNDYASMRQVIQRRFLHYKNKDNGFSVPPDLLLIDGGVAHAQTAAKALAELDLQFPVFGMVKDDRHRTRALVSPDGQEIRIDAQQSIFSLIGNIQEETHRFAISFHRQLRSKRLGSSELDRIDGIGPKRKETLLKAFKSLRAIKEATLPELEQYLPADAAQNVFAYFHSNKER